MSCALRVVLLFVVVCWLLGFVWCASVNCCCFSVVLRCSMLVVYCLLVVVCCFVAGVYCVLFVVVVSLFVVGCWLLVDVCCGRARRSLVVVGRRCVLLFVVCCLQVGV